MKLRVLGLGTDSIFIIDETDPDNIGVVGRGSDMNEIIVKIGELTGNVVLMEDYPGDYFFKTFQKQV
jgi:hypothetical protein